MTIDTLTPEKWAEVRDYLVDGRNIGTATEPADWESAEKAITKFYRLLGHTKPITFYHMPSPYAAQKLLRSKFKATSVVSSSLWGNQDSYWIQHYKFIASIPGIDVPDDIRDILDTWDIIAKSISWWYPVNKQHVIMCDRPEVCLFDDQRLLHNDKGPAVKYRDGFSVYSYHGLRIPKAYTWIITDPDKITKEVILAESNAELSRVMKEMMGISKYLDAIGAKVIHMDTVKVVEGDTKYMPRCLMEDSNGDRYLCATDGSTTRVYYMRVDSDAKTCADGHNSISPFNERHIIANS